MHPSDLESATSSFWPSTHPVRHIAISYPVPETPTKRMRLNGDVLIRIREKVFNCDRVMLAKHSEYFDVMFNGRLKESSMSDITLREYVDVGIFEEILNSLSSGRGIKLNNKNAFPVLRISTYLLIPKITQDCVDHILRRRNSMKVDDLLEIFVYARRTNVILLFDRLHRYILQRFFDLSRSQPFFDLPFDEIIQLLSEYKSMASSRPFNWDHGQVYYMNVLVQWMRRSTSDRRKPSELKELMRMTNFDKIPEEFAEFMMTEFKFRFPTWTAWRRKKLRIETDLRKFAHDTNDEVIDDILPRYRALDSARIPPIHAYVQEPRSISVYSISRLEPFWSLSLTRSVPPRLYVRSETRGHRWTHQPFTSFQCFTLSNDHSSIYCLENVKSGKCVSQTFRACSSLDIFSKSLDLAPPPKFLHESDVCSVKTNIYFYEPRIPSWGGYENKLSNSNLDFQEIRHDYFTCYNRECDRWVRAPQPNIRQENACMTADEELVYMIGGWCAERKCVQAYDHRAPRWFTIARTERVHKEAACCNLNGRIYVFDGSEMEVFDPVVGKWEIVDLDECYYLWSLGEKRRMLAYGNQLWFFTHFRSASSKVFIYDTIREKSYVNTFLMDTLEDDCEGEFAVRSIVAHPGIATGVPEFRL